jgi:hypothetical protein
MVFKRKIFVEEDPEQFKTGFFTFIEYALDRGN